MDSRCRTPISPTQKCRNPKANNTPWCALHPGGVSSFTSGPRNGVSPSALRDVLLADYSSLTVKGGQADDWTPESKMFDNGKGTATPWGQAQYRYKYARGINNYGTASHGGFKVTGKRLDDMPTHLRAIGDDKGFFEEDGGDAAVVLAFPEFFTQQSVDYAVTSFRDSFPDEYENHFEVELEPGESVTRDQENWEDEHWDDYVVRSASRNGDNIEITMERQSDGRKATSVLPKTEYDSKIESAGLGSRNRIAMNENDPNLIRPALRTNIAEIVNDEELAEFVAENPDNWVMDTSTYRPSKVGREFRTGFFKDGYGNQVEIMMTETAWNKRVSDGRNSQSKRFITQSEWDVLQGDISYSQYEDVSIQDPYLNAKLFSAQNS